MASATEGFSVARAEQGDAADARGGDPADDRGRVAGGGEVGHGRCGGVAVGGAEDQAAAGLGVGQQEDIVVGAPADVERWADVVEVALASAGHDTVGEQLAHAVEDGHGLDVDVDIRSEEHTSELQSLMRISYAVFCLKKKK